MKKAGFNLTIITVIFLSKDPVIFILYLDDRLVRTAFKQFDIFTYLHRPANKIHIFSQ